VQSYISHKAHHATQQLCWSELSNKPCDVIPYYYLELWFYLDNSCYQYAAGLHNDIKHNIRLAQVQLIENWQKEKGSPTEDIIV